MELNRYDAYDAIDAIVNEMTPEEWDALMEEVYAEDLKKEDPA